MNRSEPATLIDPAPLATRLRRAVVAAALLIGVAGGCAGDDEPSAGPSTSGAETVPPSSTTTTTTPAQALAAGLCPVVGDRAEPDPDRPVYRADLTVDPTQGVVSGSVAISFTPDLPVEQIVLRLWPNAPRPAAVGSSETIERLEVDGETAGFEQPDPTTIFVPLAGGRGAGETVELSMTMHLQIGSGAQDRIDRRGDGLRLGSFLPLLPWVAGRGWAIDPPTALFAEATTTPTADFDVGLAVPAGYDVLATGVPDGTGRWRAEAVRDVAASIGHFRLVTRVVDLPDPVEVTVGVEQSLADDPQAYLDRVIAAMTDFGARFGPYPWPTLSLAVTPGLRGGIEMPMHIMQGPDTIGRTTPHEVAHMWFYSLVGNNQAVDPWMDEGLASYAEATFEDTLDQFRAEPQNEATRDSLGRPLTYWADHPGDYYLGVYQQGAVAVGDLGDEHLVDCALRHYVADQAYGIADPADLVDGLAFVFPDAPDALSAHGVAAG